jgi:flagellar motor switch/type III secretory pathway protein FliN
VVNQEYYPYVLLGDSDIKKVLSRLQEVIQPFWAGWFSDKQPLELQIKSANQHLNIHVPHWEIASNTPSTWMAIEHADKLNEFFMAQLTGIPRRKVSESSSMISALYERFAADFRKIIFGSIGQVVLGGVHTLLQNKGCGALVLKVTMANKQVFNLALGGDFIKHLLAERFTFREADTRGAQSFGRALFDQLSVHVAVSAGTLTLPLQAVKAFEVGQVLRLDKKTSEPFSLVYQGHGPLPTHIEDVQYGRQSAHKVFQLLIK